MTVAEMYYLFWGELAGEGVTGGGGRWYIAGRGDRNGHNVSVTTRKESPWVEIFALAEKLLLLVGQRARKGVRDFSRSHASCRRYILACVSAL